MKKQKIAIIGGGRIGQSVRKLINGNRGVSVSLWDIDKNRMHVSTSLPKTLEGANIVFLCMPSWCLRSALQDVKKHTNKNAIFVSFAKGIEIGTMKRVDEIIKSELPKNRFAIFGGPFMAEELDRGFLGIGVIGTKNRADFLRIKKLFEGTNARLIHSTDVKSVALSGVLKNVYALGLGIADGFGWGTNAKGFLSAKMFDEIISIGKILGGKEKILRISGGSDLINSGFSPFSNNRKTGEKILKWHIKSIKSEGIVSLPSVAKLLGKKKDSFLIFKGLLEIVLKHKDPKVVFKKFIS